MHLSMTCSQLMLFPKCLSTLLNIFFVVVLVLKVLVKAEKWKVTVRVTSLELYVNILKILLERFDETTGFISCSLNCVST